MLFLFAFSGVTYAKTARKAYIVHMLKSMKPQHFNLHEHWYHSIITHATSNASTSDPSVLLYTYDVILHGFAAKLTNAEAASLESVDGCLAVIPSSLNKLHTTYSPQFLGLTGYGRGKWLQQLNRGEDVIVGVVDTGIWPESESFNDKGLGPIPSRWRGKCESGEQFNSSSCNRKLIGARFFLAGYKSHGGENFGSGEDFTSARDSHGHGTHTASIAAGSAVSGANFNGFGNGTAMGMAPAARVAVYKACWGLNGTCDDSDVVAAMEKATQDGVDIISLSIGYASENPFYMDPHSLAAFGAIEKDVLVSASAGNEGPFSSSLSNTAPWITTVGSSSMDREFLSLVKLGNGEVFKGSSFYRGAGIQNLPLVYDYCSNLGVDPHLFKGKVVMCNSHDDSMETARVLKNAGAAGVIFVNSELVGAQDIPQDQPYLPATRVSFSTGEKIKAYVNSTATPIATINPTGLTVVGKAIAPIVDVYSSRGPSALYPEILKPDLIAPGSNILAAWKEGGFNIISGTSMSCPHVSGIAALIRVSHPTWSPAAIRSALMTTASMLDNRKQPIKDALTLRAVDPFAMGAGHVNPRAALEPGLVYDLGPQDYINYLCGGLNNYTEKQIALLSHKWPPCPKSKSGADLNYPSFSVVFEYGERVQVKRRTVTNVGSDNAVYKVWVKSSPNVKVSVEPDTLVFKKRSERTSFNVTFESKVDGSEEGEYGEITWKCIQGGMHIVRSPIVVLWITL
ncbi:subtilisin-like protease SBT1.7 [Cryptomeria japonica]|uniref:subtilisin-like protease SBT1.7 n=1 Tax=Cryptomeria japonica TaxID=3369 RepID=UPI0027DAA205|nr:subtilisin-like protease SBT1.7 [Cryptomeria japonica]